MNTTSLPRIGVSLISAVAAFAAITYFRAAPALKKVPEGPTGPGETRVAPPGRDFSLILPKGWENIDTNSPDFLARQRARLQRFNQARGSQVKFNEAGHALYARDTATLHDPLVRTVNVLIKETPLRRADPQKAAETMGAQLMKDVPGVRVFETKAVELPVGKVPRIVSSFPIPLANGVTRNTTTITYSFRDHDRLLTLTVTGMEKDRSEVTALGDRIAASFRTLR